MEEHRDARKLKEPQAPGDAGLDRVIGICNEGVVGW